MFCSVGKPLSLTLGFLFVLGLVFFGLGLELFDYTIVFIDRLSDLRKESRVLVVPYSQKNAPVLQLEGLQTGKLVSHLTGKNALRGLTTPYNVFKPQHGYECIVTVKVLSTGLSNLIMGEVETSHTEASFNVVRMLYPKPANDVRLEVFRRDPRIDNRFTGNEDKPVTHFSQFPLLKLGKVYGPILIDLKQVFKVPEVVPDIVSSLIQSLLYDHPVADSYAPSGDTCIDYRKPCPLSRSRVAGDLPLATGLEYTLIRGDWIATFCSTCTNGESLSP